MNVSDELCAALDKVCELTGASRSGVLAVLIRVHLRNLIGFMGNLPDTIDGGEEAVTVEAMRDSGEAQFLEASAKYAHELDLLVRAFGLANALGR